jgi:hypothetical protein
MNFEQTEQRKLNSILKDFAAASVAAFAVVPGMVLAVSAIMAEIKGTPICQELGQIIAIMPDPYTHKQNPIRPDKDVICRILTTPPVNLSKK